MLENERVQFIFADSRDLYDDALEMLVVEKMRATPGEYPRRTGVPGKTPL